MEKKESLKKENGPKAKGQPKESSGKPSWITNKAFDIIKLILGILLLPFVYSSSVAFLRQLEFIDASLQGYFWAGVVTFLLIYLFVWEPARIYDFGHKLLEIIFSFFQPLVKVAPYLLPVYMIVTFLAYLILRVFIKEALVINYTVFLFGLSLALHLVFSSKSIRLKKGDLLKSNYIFGFSFIYIVNLGTIALFLNIVFKDFSFVNYCNNSYEIASGIVRAVFTQLFAV